MAVNPRKYGKTKSSLETGGIDHDMSGERLDHVAENATGSSFGE